LQEEGHILIFLTGAAEIDKCCASLRSLLATREDDKEVAFMASPHMEVVPLYGLLPPDEQARAFGAFASGDTRKCVVATNIAGKCILEHGSNFSFD
jgi:HrpA-like RNA helicase